MDNCVLAREKSAALIRRRHFGVLVWVAVCGCGGSEEAPPPPEEQPKAVEAALQDEADGQRDTQVEEGRRGGRKASAKEGAKSDSRRARDGSRMREWTSQHLYMSLTIDKIKPSEEQITTLADMNWRHFIEMEKKKAERPSLDEALLNMLTTGILDVKPFEWDRKWIAEHEAMREAQYRERMTTLHETLTGKQRTALVGLVEAEQKKRYAEEDKRLASEGKAKRPVGCGGGRGNSLTNRITGELDLTRGQKTTLDKLRTELDRENPSPEELAGHREAQRIFEMIVRKAFVSRRFDVSRLVPPEMAYTEPAAVSQCNQREFSALLEMLSQAQRKEAVKKLQERKSRRQGDDPTQ